MLEQGIHFDVASADYFGDPCPAPSLTQSLAKLVLERSPLHAKLEHPRLTPPPPNPEPEKYDAAKAIGNAAHSLMLGRGKDIAIGSFDAWTTKEAKLFKADALAAGKVPILDHHFGRAHAMVEAARPQIEAVGWNDAFTVGRGEVVIAWQENGIWFRSLIDWLTSTTRLYDYKTTGLSCAPQAIPKLMADAGWDTQAAMHERGLDVLDTPMAGRRQFRFIAQENEPPYALTCVELPEPCMIIGRKKIDMAVRLWSPCLRANIWPAYPPEVCWPEYPGWKEAQFLNQEIHAAARARTNGHRDPMLTDLSGG
jgi:hypothetical protein